MKKQKEEEEDFLLLHSAPISVLTPGGVRGIIDPHAARSAR